MFKKDSKKGAKKDMKLAKPPKAQFWNNMFSTIFIILMLVVGYSLIVDNKKDIEDVSITQLASDVKGGIVEKITVQGGDLEIGYAEELMKTARKENETSLSELLINYGVTSEQLGDVEIVIEGPSGIAYWLFNLAPFIIPFLFILIFFWFISRQAKGSGMQAFSFGQSKARVIYPDDTKQRVTFKDVAGAKEAKVEVEEIVDFLKSPKKFMDIGARIPKGVLFMGAPGTGKTLLARAIAGEAKVPFFSISGSEFVEMFVGVGASRVRDLFKEAKKVSPAIIFIDEIDAVGRVRGTGVGGGNDEREQTLNQILVEMDGFEPTEKVIVIAATNRPDVLDPALLRPGRFDRRVMLDLPDIEGREAILKIHSKKKPFEEDVKLRVIAERTPGFSGADLDSLMNEGAILAAREERKKVAQRDLIRSIEKVMLGPERKSHLLSKKEKKITAYHEAGHALMASILPYSDPVHKISIISRGHAGGYTLKLPLEERKLQSRKEFLDDVSVALGGYVAEEIVFDDITTGPSNDLQVGTALVRDMITRYGMSEKLGPIALKESSGQSFIGGGVTSRDYSEDLAAQVDAEVSKMINGLLNKTRELMIEHRSVLEAIADELMRVESIEREEFEVLLEKHGITPKRNGDNKKGGK